MVYSWSMLHLGIALPGEGFSLEGVLEGPAGAPGVVVCHPHPAFGGTFNTPIVVRLAGALAAAGLRALRFNFRGIGRSGGRPTGGAVEERDVRAACAALREVSTGEVALAGYSFGALMAAKALARGEVARAFFGLGFPTGIVGDHPDRIADTEAALRAAPALLVTGDTDPLCDPERLARYSRGAPSVRLEILPGVSHFPSGVALDRVASLAVEFLVPTSRS